jgi:hypothetical protein
MHPSLLITLLITFLRLAYPNLTYELMYLWHELVYLINLIICLNL